MIKLKSLIENIATTHLFPKDCPPRVIEIGKKIIHTIMMSNLPVEDHFKILPPDIKRAEHFGVTGWVIMNPTSSSGEKVKMGRPAKGSIVLSYIPEHNKWSIHTGNANKNLNDKELELVTKRWVFTGADIFS